MPNYSSPTGNDTTGDGSFATPWATIEKLAKNLPADGIGYLLAGPYNESVNLNTYGGLFPSGSNEVNRKIISAYPNATVTINGRFNFANQNVAYVSFVDLHINAASDSGNAVGDNAPAVTVDHIRFEGCEIYGSNNNGVGGGGTFYEFLNCHVHHNGNDPGLEHGFYMAGQDGTIDRCEINSNSAQGISIYPAGSDRWTIKNCLVHDNFITQIGANPGSSAVKIYNNIVYDGVGTGIQVNSSTDSVVYHNTVCGNGGNGIYLFTNASGIVVKNNISWGNHLIEGYDIDSDGSGIAAGQQDYNLYETCNGSCGGSNNVTVYPFATTPPPAGFPITTSSSAYAACVRLSSVPTDYDGNPRPDPASMGALEPSGVVPPAGSGSYSEITLGSLPDDPSHFIGPTCRSNEMLNLNRSYYVVQLSRSGSTYILSLAKILNGIYNHIDDTSAETFTSGDTLSLECTGSTTVSLVVKKNSSTILTGTDTSLSADGGYGFAGGGTIDAPALAWSAGTIASGVRTQVDSADFETASTSALGSTLDGWAQQAPPDGLIYYTGTGAAAGGLYALVDAVVYWTGVISPPSTTRMPFRTGM